MEQMQLYSFVFNVALTIVMLIGIYLVAKKLPYHALIQAISDREGKVSSTRIKSMLAAVLALFLVIVGTVGNYDVRLDFIITLLGYSSVEHRAEKFKDVRLSNGKKKES